MFFGSCFPPVWDPRHTEKRANLNNFWTWSPNFFFWVFWKVLRSVRNKKIVTKNPRSWKWYLSPHRSQFSQNKQLNAKLIRNQREISGVELHALHVLETFTGLSIPVHENFRVEPRCATGLCTIDCLHATQDGERNEHFRKFSWAWLQPSCWTREIFPEHVAHAEISRFARVSFKAQVYLGSSGNTPQFEKRCSDKYHFHEQTFCEKFSVFVRNSVHKYLSEFGFRKQFGLQFKSYLRRSFFFFLVLVALHHHNNAAAAAKKKKKKKKITSVWWVRVVECLVKCVVDLSQPGSLRLSVRVGYVVGGSSINSVILGRVEGLRDFEKKLSFTANKLFIILGEVCLEKSLISPNLWMAPVTAVQCVWWSVCGGVCVVECVSFSTVIWLVVVGGVGMWICFWN